MFGIGQTQVYPPLTAACAPVRILPKQPRPDQLPDRLVRRNGVHKGAQDVDVADLKHKLLGAQPQAFRRQPQHLGDAGVVHGAHALQPDLRLLTEPVRRR